ncbi:MAG TPA: hypothetical protein VF120_11740 [Ktedonobacterales bacterium]
MTAGLEQAMSPEPPALEPPAMKRLAELVLKRAIAAALARAALLERADVRE